MKSKINSRIVKNTGFLYFRMMITMAVSLYTSRLILNILGVEDFGIYNVVAGFVMMFSVLNSSMATATQRFLAFEIGKNDLTKLRHVFSMSIIIYTLIGIIIIILAESVGLWFLKTKLVIPLNRITAACTIFQFSVLTLIVNMIGIPFHAMIIAQEKMNIFAWMSIFEVCLKLFLVILLQFFDFDNLIFYSFLIFLVTVIIKFCYIFYCTVNFKESRFVFYFDKSLFKTLISYASWNLWGNFASIIMGQGINILLNIFFGPLVNAARAIAYQVKVAVNQFVLNFQMAVNPQIIKSYAIGDLEYMHKLIFNSAKYSFFLLYIFTLPVILEAGIILEIWLGVVPDYTIIFTQLILINILIDSISGPLMTAAQASGKIKVYQLVVGGLLIMNLPISYFFLNFGFTPEITLYVSIIFSLFALYMRLKIISPLIKLNILNFTKKVLLSILAVALISLIIPLFIKISFKQSIARLFLIVFTSFLFSVITIYFFGLGNKEQLFLKKKKVYFFNIIKGIKNRN